MMEGVEFVGTQELIDKHLEEANVLIDAEKDKGLDSLYGHILSAFTDNKDNKDRAGINRLLLQCLRQYNGEYDPEDLAAIQSEGGSQIYMSLTAPKVREASAWLKDILMEGDAGLFEVNTSPIPELPAEMTQQITDKITQEFNEAAKAEQGQQDTAQVIKDTNEKKRDLQDAIADELKKEAEYSFRGLQLRLMDSLMEGEWEDALDQVIDDFCVFPTAILKGPIVSLEPSLKWEGGVAVVTEDYKFLNKRVSPFDIYPCAEGSSPQEGNFIEHMKLSRSEVATLRHHEGYQNIDKVLEEGHHGFSNLVDTNIDQERADLEDKEDAYEASKNTFHSLHFFGTAPVKLLREWGLKEGEIAHLDQNDEVEIEAIVIGSQVVKCHLNKDPLNRRPYYVASFRRKPGSFWGHCIPTDMRDIQRMCNASARALANNMGLASGPITEINIERLADGFEISELKARDIIQTKNDPSGNQSRAVSFFAPPSNAQELLAVFQFFEEKADEVTMIPRYARQNHQATGAAGTATGLSMLFESGSKGIKNAIRYLDRGIIVPRVKAEFHHIMLRGDSNFTGDIVVIPKGTKSITIGGAQQIRRNEFLQVTSNPMDQSILGMEGRASILRTMAKDLDLGGYTVPSRYELKQKEKATAAQEQQPGDNVMIAKMQLDGQMQMAQMRGQMDAMKLEFEKVQAQMEQQLDAAKLQLKDKEIGVRSQTDITVAQIESQTKSDSDNKQAILSIKHNDKMN